MRINFLIISLLFIFAACSSSNSGKKMGATANAGNNAKVEANPNKLGNDVFEALKNNDAAKFKDCFLGAKYKDEMATMLTSVELTEEQKSNTLTFLDNTVKFFSDNDDAGINGFFNLLRSQSEAKGIDWSTAKVGNINSSIVSVTDFGMIINVYKIDVEFKDKTDIDHMISISRAYDLPSGVIAGDAKIPYWVKYLSGSYFYIIMDKF